MVNVSGADANDNGGLGCANPLIVLSPAQCTITGINFDSPFQSNNFLANCGDGFAFIYGGTSLTLGTCNSGSYGCVAATTCNCTGNTNVFAALQSCDPAPSCVSTNMNFTFYFFDGYQTTPCTTADFIASGNWDVNVVGQTIQQPAAPTKSVAGSVCKTTTVTLTATGKYGVPGYTYSWAPATYLSSTTTNPTNANIGATTTYTCTITDACGLTATQTVKITYAACLPIQLLSFNAQYNAVANITNLNWATASETNNNYFTVERTLDGINYTSIDSIKGAGNSTQTLYYTGIDPHPVIGVDYYRLKQTDFDGNYTYSNIVAVNVNASGKANLSIMPNPTGNQATISFVSPVIGNATLNIYDYTGRLVKVQQIAANVGTNTLPLDVSNYTNGIYFVSLNNGIQIYSSKLVVNH